MAQAGAVYRGTSAVRPVPSRRARAIRMNRIMLRLTIALIVVCLFVYITRMAAISAAAKEIGKIKQEITQLKEDQQYLEVMLAARQDLELVRDEATGRLGMRYPTEGQVQLVSLSGYAPSANTQTAHDSTAP